MDCSVRGYLERQTTEILQTMLQHYLCDGVWQSYFHAVPIILEILKQRKVNIPHAIYARITEIEELQQ